MNGYSLLHDTIMPTCEVNKDAVYISLPDSIRMTQNMERGSAMMKGRQFDSELFKMLFLIFLSIHHNER